ncbi:MAG TPA: hypothetical protein PLT66_08855, partial [Bacillota bacterium]|nr:hypothetical protein [Bacillota bacterium]
MAYIYKHKQLLCFFLILLLLAAAALTSLAEESQPGDPSEEIESAGTSEPEQSTQESEPSLTQTVFIVQSEGGKISVSDKYAKQADT